MVWFKEGGGILHSMLFVVYNGRKLLGYLLLGDGGVFFLFFFFFLQIIA